MNVEVYKEKTKVLPRNCNVLPNTEQKKKMFKNVTDILQKLHNMSAEHRLWKQTACYF
jgi:hypothetical protein